VLVFLCCGVKQQDVDSEEEEQEGETESASDGEERDTDILAGMLARQNNQCASSLEDEYAGW
jgi:hypothetical protein